MGEKIGVVFANIDKSTCKVETNILSQSALKALVWKCYIDGIFSLWTINGEEIMSKQTIRNTQLNFWAEISEMETTFLDTIILKVKAWVTFLLTPPLILKFYYVEDFAGPLLKLAC